jgi:anthranilate synthase component 1
METTRKFQPKFEELKEIPVADPLDIFRALSKLYANGRDVFFFRRSGEAGKSSHHEPTQTVIAIDPFETLSIRNGRARIKSLSQELEIEGNPFEILAQRMEVYRTPTLPDLPFFQGGAMGYFAYDSIRHVETTLKSHPGNLRELSQGQSSDATVDAEFFFFSKLVIFDHSRNKIFLMTDTSDSESERQKLKQACLSAKKSPSYSIDAAQEFSSRELSIDSMGAMLGKTGFVERVKQLKEHIKAGDIFQAVLAEKFSTPFTGNPIDLFETLMRISPSPYQFYFTAGERVFMGASPEMLVRITGNQLETHPIAGTRPRGSTPDEERKFETQLKRSEKEKSEHLMLVDLARNDTGRVSEPGSVKVPEFMELKKFAGVIHLVSRVVGSLKSSIRPVDALASFFPAGTLSGAPKVRAMQILSELEPEPRGFYGGAVFIASFSGDLDSCIAIRSIQLEKGLAIVRAGAGIVADSRPESEYAEVQHKTRMARKALAIASSLSQTPKDIQEGSV